MNAGTAVLTGVGVVAVGAAGYAAYSIITTRQGALRQATAPSGYDPYVAHPGYTGYPNPTQPGNTGSGQPPPQQKPDDVQRTAQDVAAVVGAAGAIYGLVSNIAGDVGDYVSDF